MSMPQMAPTMWFMVIFMMVLLMTVTKTNLFFTKLNTKNTKLNTFFSKNKKTWMW